MRDYSKILPHLDGIKKIADKFDGQDREVVLKMLFEDAMTGGATLRSTAGSAVANGELEMPTQKRRGRPPGRKKNTDVVLKTAGRRGRPPKAQATAFGRPKTGRRGRPPKAESIPTVKAAPSLNNVSDFLTRNGIAENTVLKLFAIGEESVMPVYESLGTDKKSQAQVRVMLLSCFAGAIATGQFIADLKAVREECKRFGVYDNNFPGNLSRQEETIKRVSKSQVELTAAGQDELANLLKSL